MLRVTLALRLYFLLRPLWKLRLGWIGSDYSQNCRAYIS